MIEETPQVQQQQSDHLRAVQSRNTPSVDAPQVVDPFIAMRQLQQTPMRHAERVK
jgi:hypothetical protein